MALLRPCKFGQSFLHPAVCRAALRGCNFILRRLRRDFGEDDFCLQFRLCLAFRMAFRLIKLRLSCCAIVRWPVGVLSNALCLKFSRFDVLGVQSEPTRRAFIEISLISLLLLSHVWQNTTLLSQLSFHPPDIWGCYFGCSSIF